MRSAFMALFLVTSTACAKTYSFEHLTDTPPEYGHYVIVSAGAKSGGEKIYDCLSFPDGKTWEPTCVRVNMTSKSTAAERPAPQPFHPPAK